MRRKISILFLKIILFLFCPPILTFILSGSHPVYSAQKPVNSYIQLTSTKATEKVEQAEYIKGIIAGLLNDWDYDTPGTSEIVKMYGVLLNTSMAKNEGALDFTYLNPELRRQLWGNEAFSQKEALLSGWLSEVSGLVMKYGNSLITPYFHQISAGATRNGPYPYLTAVETTKDMEHPDFLSVTQLTSEDFYEKIMKKYPDCGISRENPAGDLQIIARDSSGYVTKLLVGSKTISGEEFMDALCLASPSFQITSDRNSIKFITKGVGHGYGVSLNYAANLAAGQQTYDLILSYFYNNIEITNE